MIIQCPCCNCVFEEDEALKYKVKNIFNNKKPRPSTWKYLDLLDEDEATNPDSCSATNN